MLEEEIISRGASIFYLLCLLLLFIGREVPHSSHMEKGFSAVHLFKLLPPELAAITFRYSPLYLWPLAVGREDVMKHLAYARVPTEEECDNWVGRKLIDCCFYHSTPDFRMTGYEEESFHSIVLSLVRFSGLLGPGSLEALSSAWDDIGLRQVVVYDALGQIGLVRLNKSNPEKITIDFFDKSKSRRLRRALKDKFDYNADPKESDRKMMLKYARLSLRDWLSSLFGLLIHLGANPFKTMTPYPLHAYAGVWEVYTSCIRDGKASEQPGVWSELCDTIRILDVLESLVDCRYPLIEDPGFERVKVEALSALARLGQKRNIFPIRLIKGERKEHLLAVLPELCEYLRV